MATQAEVDAIHDALDRATIEMGNVSDALVTSNVSKAREAIARMSGALGETKAALRAVEADE